jgi:hypothetical protein
MACRLVPQTRMFTALAAGDRAHKLGFLRPIEKIL